MSSAINERALQFGDANGLLGVATLPAAPAPRRPAIVLLNAGLIHRVGPFRMNVELARRFAAGGFLALRMDQSGLGDSLSRGGATSHENHAVRDVRQAFDALTEHFGVDRFVLVGLCSGAMTAHQAALADPRVVGACLLDGYAYRMPKAHLRARVARATDPAFWPEAAERVVSRLERRWLGNVGMGGRAGAESAALREEEQPGQSFAQIWPPREVIAGDLGRLVARGVRLLFIYTGGWSGYVHRSQFGEMFPRLARRDDVEVEFHPDADHTYLIVAHRERMARRVEQFLKKFT